MKGLPWLIITLLCIAACTYFPIKIKNTRLRQWVNYWVLIPISILIIIYCYPAGIEVFKRLALSE